MSKDVEGNSNKNNLMNNENLIKRNKTTKQKSKGCIMRANISDYSGFHYNFDENKNKNEKTSKAKGKMVISNIFCPSALN